MEERLGVRLFARTTRSVKLTDSGRRYYEECRQALAQLVEAQREVMGQQQAPSGTCASVSLPPTPTTGSCRCCRRFARVSRGEGRVAHQQSQYRFRRRGL
jgi:DNA-binding transcriptional LysR family regulator